MTIGHVPNLHSLVRNFKTYMYSLNLYDGKIKTMNIFNETLFLKVFWGHWSASMIKVNIEGLFNPRLACWKKKMKETLRNAKTVAEFGVAYIYRYLFCLRFSFF